MDNREKLKRNFELLMKTNEKNKSRNGKNFSSSPLLLGYGVEVEHLISLGSASPEPIYINDDERAQHLGCLGTTGTGKSMFAIHGIVHDIRSGANLLVLDPKGDIKIFNAIVQAAAECGRLDELLFVSPIVPDYSNKINLLRYFHIPDELVDHVCSAIRSKEQYFINVAYEVTTAIISGLLVLARSRGLDVADTNLNFHEIKKWCDYHSLNELKNSVEYLTSSSDPTIRHVAEEVVLNLRQILASPQDFFAKVSSSLRTVLTQLSTSTTGQIIGRARENEFIKRLENDRGVILFCNTGSLLTRRTAHIVARIIISMVQAAVGRRLSEGGSFKIPLSIYMDEGHNVLYWGIQELFNKARAANVRIHFFTQSYAQIEEEVGPEAAKSIVDNISTWIIMRLNHGESAKRIEEEAPYVNTKAKVFSFRDGHLMTSVRETEDKIITADKVMKLPNRYFYLRKGGTYYKCQTPEVPPFKVNVVMPKIEAK